MRSIAPLLLSVLFAVPSVAHAQAPVAPVPPTGTPLVLQGRVERVEQTPDSSLVVLQVEAGDTRVNWAVIDLSPPRPDIGAGTARCWRFAGVADGATATRVLTPIFGLPYTVGAPRIAASAAEPVAPARSTTGCDIPRGDSNPATRFDPSTMGPAGTVPDDAPASP